MSLRLATRLVVRTAAAFVILPAALASAATTVGHYDGAAADFAPCATGASACAQLLPDVVQTAGVITRITVPPGAGWSGNGLSVQVFRGYPDAPAIVPGAATGTFRTAPGAQVRTQRLSVQPGDRIAIARANSSSSTTSKLTAVGGLSATESVDGGGLTSSFVGGKEVWAVAPGAVAPPLLTATIEPDADGDGFGDETQDACIGTAGPRCASVIVAGAEGNAPAPFGPAVQQKVRIRNAGAGPATVLVALRKGPVLPPAVSVSLDGTPCPATPIATLAATVGSVLDFGTSTEPRWNPLDDGGASWVKSPPAAGDPAPPVCAPITIPPGGSSFLTITQPALTLTDPYQQAGGYLSTALAMWGAQAPAPTYQVSYNQVNINTPRATTREASGDFDVDTKIRDGRLMWSLTCDAAVAPGVCHFTLQLQQASSKKSRRSIHGRVVASKLLTVKPGKTVHPALKLSKSVLAAARRARGARFHYRILNRLDGLSYVLVTTSPAPFKVGFQR